MNKQLSSAIVNETPARLNALVFKRRILALHYILEELIESHGLVKESVYSIAHLTPENFERDMSDLPLEMRMKLFYAKTKAELIEVIKMLELKKLQN